MKHLLFITVFLFSAPATAQSEAPVENRYERYFGTVVRVIDGDTLIAKIDLWPGLVNEIPVRVRGIDAPELRRVACEAERNWGEDARKQVEKLYGPGTSIRLENVEMDSFGRAVADIRRWRSDRWLYFGEELIQRGLAVEWHDGQDDVPWCLLAETR